MADIDRAEHGQDAKGASCPEKERSRSLAALVMPLLIVVAGFIAYAGGLAGPFIFDDIPVIQSLRRLEHVRMNFVSYPRFLSDLTFMLNHYFGGLNAAEWRAVKLAIPVFSGLLLWGIVRRTLILPRFGARYAVSAPWLALVASVLWVAHPLQTESVTYICQRYESLMGWFYLLSLYCFVRGASGGRARWWYDGAIAACLIGMGTKEVMVTAPVMILLYDYVFVSGSWRHLARNRWKIHAGLALSWLALAMLMVKTMSYAVGGGGGGGATEGNSSLAYLFTQFKVVLYYLRLAVYPHPLCLSYGWPTVGGALDVVLPMAVVGVLGAATAVALWRRLPAGFLGAWFFVVLLPSSSVVAVDDVIFEHRMYLPLAGIVVLAVIGGYHVLSKAFLAGMIPEGRRVWILGVLAGVISIAAITGTIMRNRDYRSEEVMWRDIAKKQPQNLAAQLGLGTALAQGGDLQAAEDSFSRLIETADHSWSRLDAVQKTACCRALNNMGTIRQREGAFEDAERYFRRALGIAPGFSQARDNLGVVLSAMGRGEEAEREWKAVLATGTRDGTAHYGLASLYAAKGEAAEALGHFEQALLAMPDAPGLKLAMARFLVTCGDPARRDGLRAVKLAVELNQATGWSSVDALDVLASAYAASGNVEEAGRQETKALELAKKQ